MINHGAYAAATLRRLVGEDAGQHDAPAGANARSERGREQAQRIRENVGDDDIERAAARRGRREA